MCSAEISDERLIVGVELLQHFFRRDTRLVVVLQALGPGHIANRTQGSFADFARVSQAPIARESAARSGLRGMTRIQLRASGARVTAWRPWLTVKDSNGREAVYAFVLAPLAAIYECRERTCVPDFEFTLQTHNCWGNRSWLSASNTQDSVVALYRICSHLNLTKGG